MSKSRQTSGIISAVVMRDHCLANVQKSLQENFHYTLVRFVTIPGIYTRWREVVRCFIVVVYLFLLFFKLPLWIGKVGRLMVMRSSTSIWLLHFVFLQFSMPTSVCCFLSLWSMPSLTQPRGSVPLTGHWLLHFLFPLPLPFSSLFLYSALSDDALISHIFLFPHGNTYMDNKLSGFW